jgi:hypothetical protein
MSKAASVSLLAVSGPLSRLSALGGERTDLFAQTLRMVAVLVVACVLFVGTLSAAAVAITSKAVGSAGASASEVSHDSDGRTAAATKKPLSI